MTTNQKIQFVTSLEKKAKDFLLSSPEGSISVSSIRGHVHFYHVTNGNYEYLANDEIELITSLATKKYCKRFLTEINKFKKDTCFWANDHDFYLKMGNVYAQLHPGIKQYVTPFILPDDLYVEQWLKNKTAKNSIDFGNSGYYTENNERVRSKSELIIANKLRSAGIPYRYEAELILANGMRYFPDFTVLNISTREEIYIEHCGMMDNLDYRVSLFKKLANYALAGITTGKNLILFFEDSNNTLNTLVVDKVISSVLC